MRVTRIGRLLNLSLLLASLAAVEQQPAGRGRRMQPRPFRWTKTADEILASVERFCRRISDSRD
jgi:hypothetical protein